jgi:ubiquitin-protein ligase
MSIPKNYPVSPPEITLSTPIPHPNVFGNKLCLDMLETTKNQIWEGWVPAYTIEAVLIQLQSFLFEPLPEDI